MIPFKKGIFDLLTDYLVSGRTLNAIYDALRARTPVAGEGITLQEVDGGYVIKASAGGGSKYPGAFWGVYAGVGGDYLQGGSVTDGEAGLIIVPDFLLADALGAPLASEGELLWLEIAGTANRINGYLSGGVSISGASFHTGAQASNYPTAASPGFIFGVEVGRWTAVGFSPSIRGNRNVAFYPGAGFRVGVY